MDIPPQPLPVAAPATIPRGEQPSEDKSPSEETHVESSEGAQEGSDVETAEPKDANGADQRETKEESKVEEQVCLFTKRLLNTNLLSH